MKTLPPNLRALLVLPEPAIQEKVQVFLAGEGFDCRTAGSFDEACNLLDRSGRWDLMVIDSDPPHDHGRDILVYLRNNENLAHIPAVICTTPPIDESAFRSRQNHLEYFLKKPIHDGELTELIVHILSCRRGKILLVDDEAAVRDVIRATLEHDGHSVVEAENGVGALGALEINDIDVVISDIKMPVMSGRELLAKVRSKYPELPFYLISGCFIGDIDHELLRAGAAGFLPKPFRYNDIIDMVHRGLARRRTSISGGAK